MLAKNIYPTYENKLLIRIVKYNSKNLKKKGFKICFYFFSASKNLNSINPKVFLFNPNYVNNTNICKILKYYI